MGINLKNKEQVKRVQLALNVIADGIWGPKSQLALIQFQNDHNLVADGILGPKTSELLGLLDTDLMYKNDKNISFENYFLSKNQYITQNPIVKNEFIFIHHTAGWNNPFDVVKQWENDSQGRIATEFVIGGKQIKNGDDTYDGRIIKTFPDGGQAYHLGNTKSRFMNEHSVGIELCNFGYLTTSNRTYTGVQVQQDQVSILPTPFRGYTHWHSYSDEQLKSLRKLILFIANRDSIEIHNGLIARIKKDVSTAFDYDENIAKGKVRGLLSHGNVRADKFDVFPQKELIDMLMTL